jgi:hypothetical protein
MTNLVDSIISRIRTNALHRITSSPEGTEDPWNEEQEGADWCFAEMDTYKRLYELAYPEADHRLSSQSFDSVADVSAFLQTLDELVLNGLFNFCICGGSSNPRHFELRENRDVNGILNEIIFLRL